MFEVIDYRFNTNDPDKAARRIGIYSDLESAKERANQAAKDYARSGVKLGQCILVLDKETHEVVFDGPFSPPPST